MDRRTIPNLFSPWFTVSKKSARTVMHYSNRLWNDSILEPETQWNQNQRYDKVGIRLFNFYGIRVGTGMKRLSSCPWGPVTANGVDVLTIMYVIYMETDCWLKLVWLQQELVLLTEGKLGNI